ncbi:hypothetical protein EOD42_10750 [Rhodovarius crocodyli]|uniref:Rod shape-determining protein MreD n=2 Tax=Rhodovarius crocodyli TaxID=1979269 RepID=A0A437MH05_9PROT|nr:hypothetical protein EOD42_10750 [Rhodovarius crocodyli]
MKRPKPGKVEPPSGFLRSLDNVMRNSLPLFVTALLAIAVTTQDQGPSLALPVVLPAVFFWTIFRPTAMPPLAVFLLGLLLDLLVSPNFGAITLCLIITYAVVFRMRSALQKQNFYIIAVLYSLVALGCFALSWLANSIGYFRLLTPRFIMYETLVSTGLYPILALGFTAMHKAMERFE